MKGFDCFATVRPEWAPQLRALGYEFFARYYRRAPLEGGRGNALWRYEAKGLFDVGFRSLGLYQNSSDTPAYFTVENARADARAALAAAAFHGQPADTAIYFAVDCNPAPDQLHLVERYFEAVLAIIVPAGYFVGAYGPGLVLQMLRARGLASRTWLSNAKGWRGYQDWLPHADVVQTTLPFTLPFGLQIDGNEARNDAGMWRPAEPMEAPVSLWRRVTGWFR